MAFQFYCPQGHLLEGEEAYVGSQCACPHCGTMFLIPSPPGAPEVAPSYQSVQAPVQQQAPAPQQAPAEPAPQITAAPGPVEPVIDQGPLHMVCPSGHILETPRDMLGQEAICPFCQAQFLLHYEASVEYKREAEARRIQKEARQARLWMTWSIVAAVIVFGSLLVLMFTSRNM